MSLKPHPLCFTSVLIYKLLHQAVWSMIVTITNSLRNHIVVKKNLRNTSVVLLINHFFNRKRSLHPLISEALNLPVRCLEIYST